MSYILVIFTIVAGSGTSSGNSWRKDWRYLGEFKNETACIHAARQIGMRGSDRFRCLPTDTLKAKP